eukprot:TRINITY_DN13716_c0_g1::TRINITY_DN13716_c0_g1_i1::g.16752::m.16752 TRINITY_DN13716_c0_g1::TRINITY_DN13716_c0_g1_i1::g.16752  ORF type:complete len:104 (-),score=5.50,sp/Q802G6/MSB1A_DANRE/56.52/4e-29,SelR/PF01641.13/1.4e-17,Yippee-Mis18/PF03226.9/0.11,CheR/PF01739.13/0.17 TRINITY_DN13716_c0_g1_i1:639-911(-)
MSFCSWKSEVYKDHFDSGIYKCSRCSSDLFYSGTKFQHDSPWPAFTNPVTPTSVKKVMENHRCYKVHCAACGNGLGHEFLGDGPNGTSRF